MNFRVCRFCKGDEGTLLKYSVRHYAHAQCGLEARGGAFLDNFTDWQLACQFPYLVAKRFGVEGILDAAAKREGIS